MDVGGDEWGWAGVSGCGRGGNRAWMPYLTCRTEEYPPSVELTRLSITIPNGVEEDLKVALIPPALRHLVTCVFMMTASPPSIHPSLQSLATDVRSKCMSIS